MMLRLTAYIDETMSGGESLRHFGCKCNAASIRPVRGRRFWPIRPTHFRSDRAKTRALRRSRLCLRTYVVAGYVYELTL